MRHKSLILGLCTILGSIFFCTGCLLKKEEPQLSTEIPEEPVIKNVSSSQNIQTPKSVVKKINLYSSTPYDLPLFSVVEISKQPLTVQKAIDKILEDSQGFYLLKKENDKIVILLQNPVSTSDTYTRHDLQFAEVDMNGNVNYHSAGYNGINGEIFNSCESAPNEEWEFDDSIEPQRPLKHIAYDENGHIKFIENWNYDDNEPIKYQLKNADKKIVSILKEYQDNDTNYRKEHVFYDNDGKTTMSLSVNFDGANISRMMFYNSQESEDSVNIISEYTDGVKTKELIYNNDYELVNTVVADYQDGERKDIKVFDNQGNKTEEISS